MVLTSKYSPVSMTENESFTSAIRVYRNDSIWLPEERLKQKDGKPRGQIHRDCYYVQC